MKKSSLALSFILLAALQANAADETAQNNSGYDWSGKYIGLYLGYLDVEDDFLDTQFGGNPNFSAGTASDEGAQAGIYAGHNWLNGNVLYGVEADIGFGDADAIGTARAGIIFGRAELNWQASLRARLGYVKDDLLVYATGGVNVADFDLDFTFPVPVFGIGDEFSDRLTGYTVGGGLEYAVGDTSTIKFEYRYSDFGSTSSSINNCCAPAPFNQTHDLTSNSVIFGISRKLN